MLAQRVGNLVANHRGKLIVGGFDLRDQAGIDGDLASGHAPGVDLVAGQHVDFPFPARRIRAKNARLRN
ncbi:hypothetical protein D3C87_2062240 [compost metagenome]